MTDVIFKVKQMNRRIYSEESSIDKETYIFKDIPRKLFNGDVANSGLKTPEELSLFVEKYGREKIRKLKMKCKLK